MEYLVTVDDEDRDEFTVTDKELPAAYADLEEGQSPTVTWNDGGDEVIIVAVNDDYCVITLMSDDTWYYLTVSDDAEEVPAYLGETEARVPRGALAPRDLGLTVLLRADDLPGLRTDYSWTAQ